MLAGAVQAQQQAYSYLGCFADRAQRAWGGQPNGGLVYRNDLMTVQLCASEAAKKKCSYFAVQNGNECYCSPNVYQRAEYDSYYSPENKGTVKRVFVTANGFEAAQKYGPQNDIWGVPVVEGGDGRRANICNKPCAGDPSTTCGGPWANQVICINVVLGLWLWNRACPTSQFLYSPLCCVLSFRDPLFCPGQPCSAGLSARHRILPSGVLQRQLHPHAAHAALQH